jgi:pyruvate kinase
MKKTKIICTLGPASREPAVLEEMMAAGMDVARLNFSHGSHEDHRSTLATVRATAERHGKEVAVLQDLQGPKIRVGTLDGDQMQLEAGQTVSIVHAAQQSDASAIPTTYAELAKDVKVGNRILMDDGLLRMRVTGVEGERVQCEVEVGGTLKNRKGINLPGVAVSAPALTDKDLADLDFGTTIGVDFLCLSFVRSAECVLLAKRRLESHGRQTPIIAKIEKPEAVERIAEILDVVDGIMVARGDLGVELGPEKVPLVQKFAIEEANKRGKLVITATQMLESMVTSTFPTRAEASDVANAVLDQSDAVMLSAETATGKHPPLAVKTMADIIREIEASERYHRLADLPPLDLGEPANALAHAAAAASESLGIVDVIVCISAHGIAPTLLSDYRPSADIYALTAEKEHCQRLAAYWGLTPILFHPEQNTEATIERVEKLLLERGIAKPGESVLLTLAVPPGKGQHTNTLKLHRIAG